MKKHFLAASFLLSAMTTFGAGYQLNLQGVRQLAMGGSGTAWPWDASTIFYNPGGLARLKGIQVYGSFMSIAPVTAYGNAIDGTGTVSQHRTFTPINIYIGGPIQEGSKFALGLGIYSTAGMGLTWDDNWLGKYIVQSVDMKSICFQPTLSYRVSDFLSIGAGFVYAAGSLDMRMALPVHGYQGPGLDDGQALLHGNTTGVGCNLGIQMRPSENLQLGLTYRSQLTMDLGGGTAKFKVPYSMQQSFPDTHFDTQLPIPQVASFGLGWRLGDVTLQFDLNYTVWNTVDSLRFNFTQNTSALQNIHAPRHYRNTLTPRLGANYKISRIVSVMVGGAFDPTPVTNNYVSPDLPDANRGIVTCGVAVKPLRGFTIMAAFEGTGSAKRAGTYEFGGFNGTYQTQAVTTGFGIYYNF